MWIGGGAGGDKRLMGVPMAMLGAWLGIGWRSAPRKRCARGKVGSELCRQPLDTR